MNNIPNNEVSERIVAARKDAEQLKEKIKQKRDQLADTTCNYLFVSFHRLILCFYSDTGCTKGR